LARCSGRWLRDFCLTLAGLPGCRVAGLPGRQVAGCQVPGPRGWGLPGPGAAGLPVAGQLADVLRPPGFWLARSGLRSPRRWATQRGGLGSRVAEARALRMSRALQRSWPLQRSQPLRWNQALRRNPRCGGVGRRRGRSLQQRQAAADEPRIAAEPGAAVVGRCGGARAIAEELRTALGPGGSSGARRCNGAGYSSGAQGDCGGAGRRRGARRLRSCALHFWPAASLATVLVANRISGKSRFCPA
jgi:hypothetical protein